MNDIITSGRRLQQNCSCPCWERMECGSQIAGKSRYDYFSFLRCDAVQIGIWITSFSVVDAASILC